MKKLSGKVVFEGSVTRKVSEKKMPLPYQFIRKEPMLIDKNNSYLPHDATFMVFPDATIYCQGFYGVTFTGRASSSLRSQHAETGVRLVR